MVKKVLIIDNYDSFTYTIKHYIDNLNHETQVIKNDQCTLREIQQLSPTHIVLSPGPGTPDDAGITLDVIKHFYSVYPMLGICLGHQAIAQAFGCKITNAKRVMHGKVSKIQHTNEGVFFCLPQEYSVTRYHSLIAEKASLPEVMNITAWTHASVGDDYEIMGIQHKSFPIYGVQFHPEAIMTEHGYPLFENFLMVK